MLGGRCTSQAIRSKYYRLSRLIKPQPKHYKFTDEECAQILQWKEAEVSWSEMARASPTHAWRMFHP